MTRLETWDGRSNSGDGTASALNDATVDDNAAARYPRVAGDPRTLVDAHISVERNDVAVDRAADVEIAPRHRDRPFDARVHRDRSIAEREVVGVGQILLAGRTTPLDLASDASRVCRVLGLR